MMHLSEHERLELMRLAKSWLEHRGHQEAQRLLEQELLEGIGRTDPDQRDERELLYFELRALRRLKERLAAMKLDGEAVEKRHLLRSI